MTPLERAGWCWFRLYDERSRLRQRLAFIECGRSVSDHAEYLTEVVALIEIHLADLSRLLAHQTREHPFQSVLRPVLPAPVADAFCAVVGDPTRFPTGRHLIAYLGLAPHSVRRPTLNRIYYTHASCLVRRRNATDTRWMQAYQRARGRGLKYMAALRCAWRALFGEAWKKSRPQPSSLRATQATQGDET
jgi:transposase